MNKGIWIPSELIDIDISWTKRVLLCEISQLEMLEKGCIASNAHFSDKLKLSKQAVSKALNELNKDGYILIDNAQTKRNFGRKITINFSKSAINLSKSAIHESGESKENKTINKTINSVIEYLNAKADKRFNNKSKDSQLLKQLIKQNYTLDDFKLVIDHKVYEWLNDAEMKKFLRPSTLFGSKFDRYLNEAIPQKKVRRLG